MTGARLWPAALIGVLVVTVAANGYLLYQAGREDGFLIEPDYYRKAVLWDSTVAQAARNRTLGWRLGARLEPDGRLAAELATESGEPITGAVIAVEGFAIARRAGGFSATLTPAGGRYQVTVPVLGAELYELRFAVQRGDTTFTAVLRGTPGEPLVPKA